MEHPCQRTGKHVDFLQLAIALASVCEALHSHVCAHTPDLGLQANASSKEGTVLHDFLPGE